MHSTQSQPRKCRQKGRPTQCSSLYAVRAVLPRPSPHPRLPPGHAHPYPRFILQTSSPSMKAADTAHLLLTALTGRIGQRSRSSSSKALLIVWPSWSVLLTEPTALLTRLSYHRVRLSELPRK